MPSFSNIPGENRVQKYLDLPPAGESYVAHKLPVRDHWFWPCRR